MTAVEIVLVPDAPCASLTLPGFAEMEKSLLAGVETVRVTVVEWVAEVPVPVIVSM